MIYQKNVIGYNFYQDEYWIIDGMLDDTATKINIYKYKTKQGGANGRHCKNI